MINFSEVVSFKKNVVNCLKLLNKSITSAGANVAINKNPSTLNNVAVVWVFKVHNPNPKYASVLFILKLRLFHSWLRISGYSECP